MKGEELLNAIGEIDEMLPIRQIWIGKERWRNRRQKRILLILCIVLGALLELTVGYLVQYPLLLVLRGFSLDPKAVLCSGVSAGEEYRIIGDSPEVPVQELLLIRKDKLGIWHVQQYEHLDENTSLIMLGEAGDSHLTESPNSKPLHDLHYDWQIVIIGNNAAQFIPNLTSVWRNDVAIDVRQSGSFYLIHIVWYGEELSIQPIELIDWLKENHYIINNTGGTNK